MHLISSQSLCFQEVHNLFEADTFQSTAFLQIDYQLHKKANIGIKLKKIK